VSRSGVLMLAALALAGCSMTSRFAYLRADGQDLGDPTVAQQFSRDRAACGSEMHNTAGTGDPHRNNSFGGGDAAQDCMEAKGYIVVTDSEAVARQQDLAAKAAEKARREAEAAAPPPPPPPPPPHKAKPKPKPKPAAPAPISPPLQQQPKS
jgi:outer membrane biosynthesis protein TonB